MRNNDATLVDDTTFVEGSTPGNDGIHSPTGFRPSLDHGVSRYRRIAALVGGLFIVGDIAGVLSGVFISDLLKEPGYLDHISTHQWRLVTAAICILAMGSFLAVIPVVMYPIFRRQQPALAMGYVVVRGALETVLYIAQASALLLLVALSRDYAKSGSADAQFGTLGRLLVKAHESIVTDVLAMVFGFGALLFGYLLYTSRLVPRWLSTWGLAGAPLYFACGVLGLFRVSAGFLMAPLALQEVVLGVWLIAKGFDSRALPSSPANDVGTV